MSFMNLNSRDLFIFLSLCEEEREHLPFSSPRSVTQFCDSNIAIGTLQSLTLGFINFWLKRLFHLG